MYHNKDKSIYILHSNFLVMHHDEDPATKCLVQVAIMMLTMVIAHILARPAVMITAREISNWLR